MAVASGFYSSGSGGGGFYSGASGGGGYGTLGTYTPPSTTDPSELTPNKMLQGVVKLLLSDDPDDKRQGQKYLEDNADQFTDEELAQYNITRPKKDDRSLFEKAAGGVVSGIQTVGGILSRPQQAVASGLKTTGMTIGGTLGVLGNRATGGALLGGYDDVGLGDVASTHARNLREGVERTFDISGESDINTREMLGVSGDLGGSGWFGDYVVGGADIAGQIATDPLSWVGTAGAGKAAEAGLGAFERARPGLREAIMREGRRVVTDADVAAARAEALAAAEGAKAGARKGLGKFVFGEGEKVGGPISRFKEGALLGSAGLDARTGLARWAPRGTGLAGDARVAERNIAAALSRGQKGVRFGNETLLPRFGRTSLLNRLNMTAREVMVANPKLAAAAGRLDQIDNQLAHAAEETERIGQAPVRLQEEVAALEEERMTLLRQFEDANLDARTMRMLTDRTFTPNPEFEQFERFPFFGDEMHEPTERAAAVFDTPDGGTELRATLANGDTIRTPIHADEDLQAARARLKQQYIQSEGASMSYWKTQIEPTLFPPQDSGNILNQPFYHGTSKGLPEQLANLDDGLIDPLENLYGPSFYQSNDLDVTRGYMNTTGGQKPERYITRWLGEEEPQFFDLDKAPHEAGATPLPDNVERFMRDTLMDLDAGRSDIVDDADEMMEGYYTPLDEALDTLDNMDATPRDIYDSFKSAIIEHYSANDFLDAEEKAAEIMTDLTRQFREAGFHGFTHEGGHIMGNKPHRVHVVFDPGDNISHTLMPPEGFPQTNLPEGYHRANMRRNALGAVLEESSGKLDKARRKMHLKSTDDMAQAVEGLMDDLEFDKAARKKLQVEKKEILAKQAEYDSIAEAERANIEEINLLREGGGEGGERFQQLEDELQQQADRLDFLGEELDELNMNWQARKDALLTPDVKKSLRAQLKELQPYLDKNVVRDAKKMAKLGQRTEDLTAERAGLEALMGDMPAQVPKRIEGKLTRSGDFLRGLFKTDAGMAVRHGEGARTAFQQAEAGAQGRATSRGEEFVRRIENSMNAAKDESADFVEELRTRIYPAMETEGGAGELIAEYASDKRTAAANFVAQLDEIRRTVTESRRAAGLLEEGEHNVDTWMQRILTPEAAKAYRQYRADAVPVEGAGGASSLLQDLTAEGSMEARKIGKDLPVGPELQQLARDELQQIAPGFSDDADVFDMNPATSVASSAVQAERQLSAVDFLKELESTKDVAGAPLLTRDPKIAKTLRYASVDAPGGKVFAPPEVQRALGRFQDVMVNDQSLKAMKRGLNKAMRIWKAQATVPLVGFAFHGRNAQTNIILNWFAGVENPVYYTRAFKLQRKINNVAKTLGKEDGASWEKILEADVFTDAERDVLRGAMDRGVLQTDYVGHGLESAESVSSRLEARNVGRARKVARKGKFWNTDQALGVKSGRATGRWIENNGRLAHYLWGLDEFGDAETAASSVRKFLFDYNDLTPFERNLKENYIPFYTFMRKNTALMVNQLIENPGKARRFTMAEEKSKDEDAAFLKDKLIPAYQIMGQGGGQAPRILDPAGFGVSVESPLSAATDTALPFIQAAELTPGLNRVVPDQFANVEGSEGVARDLLNLPGGPVFQGARTLMGKAYDIDPFTGGPARRQGTMDKLLGFTDILAVSPSKVARTVDKLALGGRRNKDFTDEERSRLKTAALVNLLTGLNASAITATGSEKEATNRWYREIKDYIDRANRDLDADDPRRIPTLEELMEEGKLPRAGGASPLGYGGGGGTALGY